MRKAAGCSGVVLVGLFLCGCSGARPPEPTVPQASRPAKDPLIEAVTQGDVGGAKRLLDGGANIETRNATGRTGLMLAAVKGPPDMVKLFVDRGAQVNAQDEDGVTPLMWGAFGGLPATVQTLLDRKADFHAKDKTGQTALDWGKEHPAIVALLKKADAKSK